MSTLAGATKGDRTRRRLLDATAAEVARHGIAGASITAIAKAAGLKTGSIYFHYASRDSLIEAMLEEGLLAALDHLESALSSLPEGANAAARLEAAIHAHAAAVQRFRNYTVAVLGSLPHASARGARGLRRAYVARWSELIEDAQTSGALPSQSDPRLMRGLLFGALNAVGLTRKSADQIATTLIALLRFVRVENRTGSVKAQESAARPRSADSLRQRRIR